jgi:hypothetical protein
LGVVNVDLKKRKMLCAMKINVKESNEINSIHNTIKYTIETFFDFKRESNQK